MDRDFLLLIFISCSVVACLLGGAVLMDRVGCLAKTADMGFDSRYSLWAGCQIEVKEGQWIPLDSYYFKEE
jgi:hypothetical protein